MKKYLQILCLTIISAGVLAPQAHADIFAAWLKPKAEYVSGTGEVFKRYNGSVGGGVEAGLKLLGMTLWGDVIFMGDSQYIGSGNFGYELSFGKKFRVTGGAYLGVMLFGFPPAQGGAALSDTQRMSLMQILDPLGFSVDDFESEYESLRGGEAINDKAVGGNARLRLVAEYQLAPLIYLGVQGGMGYHFIMSGEQFSDNVTDVAIDAFLEGQSSLNDKQRSDISAELKNALGVESSSVKDLAGINYHAGLFVNLSF